MKTKSKEFTLSPSKTKSDFVLKDVLFLNRKDKRYKKYKSQLKTRGFADSELWNLDTTISCFILPRLVRFKTIFKNSHPPDLTNDEWRESLDKMICAFEILAETPYVDKYDRHKAQEGLELFAQYFTSLWD